MKKGFTIFQDSGIGLHKNHRFRIYLCMSQFFVVPGVVHSYCNNLHLFLVKVQSVKHYSQVGIKGSILHHNILRYANTERSKIPYRLYTSVYHFICNFLSYINRYCQHTDIHVIFFSSFASEIIRMKNRNAIQVFFPPIRG